MTDSLAARLGYRRVTSGIWRGRLPLLAGRTLSGQQRPFINSSSNLASKGFSWRKAKPRIGAMSRLTLA